MHRLSERIVPHRGLIAPFALRARTGRRVLQSLVIASLLFTAGAACCQSAPPTTQQKPKATAQSTAKQGGVAPATANAGAPVTEAAPRALRESMAEMLEGSPAYRTGVDGGAPRLLDVKFAGPIRARTSLLGSPETFYCVSAKIDFWPIPQVRTAVLKVVTDQNGKPRILATVGLNGTPFACQLINDNKYGPFPEMEAARKKRRQALGKAD